MDLAVTLFRSRARVALLRSLFVDRRTASLAELSRRAGLDVRGLRREVGTLRQAGLIRLESVGSTDLASARWDHPAAEALATLLRPTPPPRAGDVLARETLAAHGAPLEIRPRRSLPLEDALLRGLAAARLDDALLPALAVVVARNADRIAWADLREEARRLKQKADLGMIVDLTATLLDRPELSARVQELRDRRRRIEPFREPLDEDERAHMERVTPEVVRSWGYLLAIDRPSFASALAKHAAPT